MLAAHESNIPDLSNPLGDYTISDFSVNARVEGTLEGTYTISHNDFYNRNIVVSESYGVCIRVNMDDPRFDFQNFQLQLRVCIDTIYRDGAYFDNLDRELFECILYGTGEEVKSKIDPVHGGIRICSQIRKMSELEGKYFDRMYGGKIQISKDCMEATFTPEPLDYVEKQFGENFKSHPLFILRSDLFHAYFWGYGIKYHGTSTFLKDINNQGRDQLDNILKNSKGVIAIGKKVTDTRDDIKMDYEAFEKIKDNNEKKGLKNTNLVNPFPPLKPVLKPLVIDGKTALGGEKTCTFPMAKSGQCILEIIRGKLGNTGITISGQGLPCAEIKQITLLNLLENIHSEYIDIDEADPRKIRIVAKEDVYISLDKAGKLGFSRHKKYVGPIGSKDIGSKTGSLVLPMDGTTFELKGAIQEGYYIRGYDIVYSGELRGKIFAQNSVTIKGGGVIGGTIIAENGDIIIDENVRIQDGTRIEAINGRVIIKGNLNNTTIVAKEIDIQGRAINCIFMGGHVHVGINEGSKVMAESFKIGQDRKEAEYTLLIYAGIQGLIDTFNKKIQETEGKGILEMKRIQDIGIGLNGDQILTEGILHSESTLQLMVVPFFMKSELQEFLDIGIKPENLYATKREGLSHIIELDNKNEGVIYDRGVLPLTRTSAMQILVSKLLVRANHIGLIPRAERSPVYKIGLRIPVTIGQLQGHIFDYSDTGGSFRLLDIHENSNAIQAGMTINISLSSNKHFALLVTRVINTSEDGKKCIYVAGKYTTTTIGPEISRVVNILATRNKKGGD